MKEMLEAKPSSKDDSSGVKPANVRLLFLLDFLRMEPLGLFSADILIVFFMSLKENCYLQTFYLNIFFLDFILVLQICYKVFSSSLFWILPLTFWILRGQLKLKVLEQYFLHQSLSLNWPLSIQKVSGKIQNKLVDKKLANNNFLWDMKKTIMISSINNPNGSILKKINQITALQLFNQKEKQF